jgi:hypothetical protein
VYEQTTDSKAIDRSTRVVETWTDLYKLSVSKKINGFYLFDLLVVKSIKPIVALGN